jgi:parvulin-like peptidyl-prolyl isomerase
MNATLNLLRLTAAGVMCGWLACGSLAKDAPVSPRAAEFPVAATVNGDPIYVGEVDAMAVGLIGGRKLAPEEAGYHKADALQQLVTRRLGETVLWRDEKYIKKADVDKALADLKAKVEANKTTLEQYAATRHIPVDALRHDLAWNIGWGRYVAANLTASLETYFNKHHQNYDGTLVRASHVLLRASRPGETNEQLVAQAQKIRSDVEDGKLTFEAAVEKYSAGPSRSKGGDLGFFPRFGVMVDGFSRTAFNLEQGKLSKPVVTPFGVHLIRVTEIKPGSKQWTETIDQIRDPATMELVEELAKEERIKAKVEFTGNSPYFKPGTNELILGRSK